LYSFINTTVFILKIKQQKKIAFAIFICVYITEKGYLLSATETPASALAFFLMARKPAAETLIFCFLPSTMMVVVCILTFHFLQVCLIEWETFLPDIGFFPVTGHVLDITVTSYIKHSKTRLVKNRAY